MTDEGFAYLLFLLQEQVLSKKRIEIFMKNIREQSMNWINRATNE